MAEGTNPDRACDRCRERRVKCDKRHPACYRCEKLGQPCPGYAKKRKFVDEGAALRKKFQSASHQRSCSEAESANIHDTPNMSVTVVPQHGSPYGAELTYHTKDVRSSLDDGVHDRVKDKPHVEVGVKQQETQSPIQLDPVSTLETTMPPDGMIDDMIDEFMAGPSYDPDWFNLDPASFYGKGNNSCGFLPNAPNIVDEVDKQTVNSSLEGPNATLSVHDTDFDDGDELSDWADQSQFQTSSIITDEREHEMAYLIRYFSEFIGPWMDLFDCERHFAQLVPLKALRDVLLKNAIAAVAAKQLGRVKGSRSFMGLQHQTPASMEYIESSAEIDWFYKAANYYDKAITYSRIYLQALSGTLSAPPTPITSASISTADSDDLLLAVSIFSLYESLDNVEVGWTKHLTGLKSILSVVNPPTPSHSLTNPVSLGRRASFWNFARADYQSAFINQTHTLLDPEDMPIWLDEGLQLQPNGNLYPNPEALHLDRSALCATNQLVAHTLLWILLRTMNFLFSSDTSSPDRHRDWKQLCAQLDAWQAATPSSFQPCAKLRHPVCPMPRVVKPSGVVRTMCVTELFFSIPLCAATVQLYHFARLLLILNQPPTTSYYEASAMKSPSETALAHAYAIIGIALARPHPAVRVEMLLPLYLAGVCLRIDEERQVVVDVLRAIEKDTGCETQGRVKRLMTGWGWSSERLVPW